MAAPTIVNPESIVALMMAELDDDPSLKPPLLRSLLTDEFLLLPSKVDQLMELPPKVDQLMELMELPPKVEQLMELPPKVEQLMELPPKVEQLMELPPKVEQLMELPPKVEQLMELPPKVEQLMELMELPSKVDRMQGQLNNLTGNDYERRIARLSATIVRRHLNLRHARLLQAITKPDNESIADLANAAAAQGSITDDDAEGLIWADLVLLDTASTPEPVYVVAEVSLTLDDHDVDRAARRARILRNASGNDARPVVIGTGISDANRQRAEDSGVTVILVADREQDRPNPPPATIA